MRTIALDNTSLALPPSAATIGFFDGVHRGHQYLVAQVTEAARRAGLLSMAITFDRHPRQTLHSEYVPQLLTTLDEKLSMLSKTGVDTAVVLPFDSEMARMTARDFMLRVLRERLNVRELVIGYDNRFGCGRTDGFEDYVRYGKTMGIEVARADALTVGGRGVSSSAIRRLLQEGDVEAAALLLGYNYAIEGTVVSGCHEGSRLGFPTANIDARTVPQLVPANGVYAVRVSVEGEEKQYNGMTNIGRRPTFAGTDATIETNIFDFHQDLYGSRIAISMIQRLRCEQRFDTPEQLAKQLAEDKKRVEQIVGK